MCDGVDIEVNEDGLTSHPCIHCGRSFYAYRPKDLMPTYDFMMMVFGVEET